MSVTKKFGLIAFVVMPVGFFGILISLMGHDPWVLISIVAWICFCIFLLFRLRCPKCQSRVFQPMYWPLHRPELYRGLVVLCRCGHCGHDLDSGQDD